MLSELQDQLGVYKAIHQGIDRMLSETEQDKLVVKPAENMNSVAAILDHVARVEKKFLSFLTGESVEIDTGAPFKESSWDYEPIHKSLMEARAHTEHVLSTLQEEDLNQFAVKLGPNELNKRQLISYMIAHTAHHRGQIPIVKKFLPQ